MIQTLLEGVRASIQPCSLALVLPALGATLAGGSRGFGVAGGYALAAGVLAWAQASLLLTIEAGGLVGPGLAVLAAVGCWLVAGRDARTTTALGGALIGGAAGLLWQPCVGPQLGAILTAAPDEPLGSLAPMMVYLAGLLASTVVVAAATQLTTGTAWSTMRLQRAIGLLPVALLIVVLASGQYATVIGALVRASGLA